MTTTTLVHTQQGSSSGSRALEKVTKGLNDVANPGALIKAMIPSLAALRGLNLGFNKTPPNIIRVVLEQKVVNPGDTIRGVVKIMVSEPIPVQEVTVQLWGRLKTYAGLYNAVRGRVPFESYFTLIDTTVTVEVEHKVLAPKVYEFPFEVPLSRTVTITEAEWPFDENTKRFNSNFTQPLPASFETFSTAHAYVDGSIKYFVTAKLASKTDGQDIKHRTPLIVKSTDAKALMGNDTINTCYMKCPFKFRLTSSGAGTAPMVLQAGKSTPGASMTSLESVVAGPSAPRSPGTSSPKLNKFKDMAKDNLLRFRLPAYAFDLDAEIPRAGRTSEVLPVVLKLSWHPPKSNKPIDRPPPPTTLTSMVVSLQSRFMTRGTTKDDFNDVSFGVVSEKATWHCIWRSKPIVISELKDPIELGPETETERLMFVHPHSFLPAFKTFSIGREYVLTVTCGLTCGGEKFQAKYEVDNFNILADASGDSLQDDFDAGRPKRYRRPAAHLDGDSDAEDEEEEEASESGSDMEEGEDVGIEDELFKKDNLKSKSFKVTVQNVNEQDD